MPAPTFPGVYVEEKAPGLQIVGVPTSTAAFVGPCKRGPVAVPTPLQSFADFERLFGGLASGMPLGYAVRQFFDNGGRDAVLVRCGARTVDKALAALEQASFNLLCIPPLKDGADLPGTTRAAAAALCRRRRAMFIVDPSQAWTRAGEAAAGLDAYFPQRGPESALYFPFLTAADPLADGKVRAFAPCGAIAGLIAASDINRGLWKAPSGALTGFLGPAIPIGGLEVDLLAEKGINMVRMLTGRGTVAWGARTLTPADGSAREYKYIPVRRLAAYIEESVSKSLMRLVFEPNAEVTWALVRNAVSRFLDDLWRSGALLGAKPSEAYMVTCDARTTTPADIAAGRANLEIGIAPTRPAEFLILKLGLAMEKP